MSDKIAFKSKKVTRDKEGHYILIKGSLQPEDITVINIYVPNKGTPKSVKQKLTKLKEETDGSTIIVGEFSTPLSIMDRITR